MLDWQEPLKLDAVVDRSLALAKSVWPRALPLALAVGVANELLTRWALAGREAELLGLAKALDFGALLERFGAATAVLVVFGLWVGGALIHLIGALARGRDEGAPTSLAAALRALPQLMVAAVLVLLATCSGLALAVGVTAYAGPQGMVGALLFGMALAQLLWAAVAFSLWNIAVMLDGHDAAGALGVSLRYTREHWWRTFGFMMLVGLGAMFAMLLGSLAIGLLAGVARAVAGPAAAEAVTALLTGALGGALGLVVNCMQIGWYHDLALRAGGRPPRDPGSLAV